MRRVAVFNLGSIGNFGDEIIADTTAWLIRSLRPDFETEFVQLQPFARHYPISLLPDYVFGRLYWAVARRVLRHCPPPVRFPFERLAWGIRNGRYFRSHLRGAAAVVYAMGMIKFRNQGFCYLSAMVNKEATRLGIPVMLSAGSVARAEPSDLRCRLLRAALHEPSVRAISTRDGETGVERLRRDYGLDLPDLSAVGDPALWILECYGIRLHSCLTAWALGVPVAGVDWEDKIRCVAASLGASAHFIPARSLSATAAVDNLLRAMSEPIDQMALNRLRTATRTALGRFLDGVPGDAPGGGKSRKGGLE